MPEWFRSFALIMGAFALISAFGAWADARTCRLPGALAGAAVVWAWVLALLLIAVWGDRIIKREAIGTKTGWALALVILASWFTTLDKVAGSAARALGCGW